MAVSRTRFGPDGVEVPLVSVVEVSLPLADVELDVLVSEVDVELVSVLEVLSVLVS